MSGVLFVCTGNMCRSPLAEAKFKKLMEDYGITGPWEVGSAGTWIPNGLEADKRMVEWAAGRGLDLSGHVTRRVSGKLLVDYDLVVVMDSGHREAIMNNYPGMVDKVVGLSELSEKFYDIPDPVSLPDKEFEEIAVEVESLVEKGFNQIIKQLLAYNDLGERG
ncbi:MAG TPA: hypothetical protein VJ965_03200 [Anaerolineales bacterium]|nr:hypothetical protein [Anaerolineales bacterium]